MARIASTLAGIALGTTLAVSGVAATPIEQAKAKIAQCVEKQGDEYVEARDWLLSHPEALELLSEISWRETWVKRICDAWMKQKDLCERAMRGFDLAEIHAKTSVRVVVPSLSTVKNWSRNCGDALVPVMVECLWKTGSDWRRYKAWRRYAVVEYLKRHGDASIVEPAVESLVSQSWNGKEDPDPGSEYPRMDPFTAVGAHDTDQLAPYTPVKLIVEFGEKDTLQELRSLRDRPQTSDPARKALQRSIELLERRLGQKTRGEPTEEVDLAVEFGDHRTLENLRIREGLRGNEPFKQRIRERAARLEKRLKQENESGETK